MAWAELEPILRQRHGIMVGDDGATSRGLYQYESYADRQPKSRVVDEANGLLRHE